MYRFSDKQRRQMLEDALVADLLEAALDEERETGGSQAAVAASTSAPTAASHRGPKARE